MNLQLPKNKKSITLIGMAGAGKSFIGKRLAQKLNFDFIDTDDLIEQTQNMQLQEILDQYGDKKFIAIENDIILSLKNIKNKVISPGGSIIYSQEAMQFLNNNSIVIYLADDQSKIITRIKNLYNRGIVGLKNKSFGQLYKERDLLYKKHADFIIDMSQMQTDDKEAKAKEVTELIIQEINKL